ncbi:MAG: hypothetical protein GY797_18200 [Deltaproteobacteria bacterium]|nr:hypothetical protein [Deltaproteobacteria bacterium]
MTTIVNFITVLAVWMILKVLFNYLKALVRERKSGMKMIWAHLKNTNVSKDLIYFRLSLLWLIVFFFSYILLYVNRLFVAVGLESLAF